jgi:hypothetical protein
MLRKRIKKSKLSFFKKVFNKREEANKDNDKNIYQKEDEYFSLLTTMYNFDDVKKSNKWINPQNLNGLYHSIDDIEISNENEEQWNYNLYDIINNSDQKNINNNNKSINSSYNGIHIWKNNKSIKFLLLFVASIGFSGSILGIYLCQYILPTFC